MNVVEKKPIPIYETTCPECKSVIEYIASEVSFTGYITCPVCGMSVWANKIMPKRYADAEKMGDGYYIKWVNMPFEDFSKTNDYEYASQSYDVEAEPIKRGEWVNINPMVDSVQCSNCGYQLQSTELATPYCPWCGAQMENNDGRD